MLNSAYAFSIYSEDEKREDQKRDAKPTWILPDMYLEKVKEAYKW